MAISSKPEEKFAFLFTGSASQQYVEDIRKVLETLIKFYGYLPENIDVVSGESIPDFVVPDPPDPNNIFHTSGLAEYVLSGSDEQALKDDLQAKIESFMTVAAIPVSSLNRNCSFMYFTGIGSVASSFYQLEIGEISGTPPTPVNVRQNWLTAIINGNTDFTDNNHLNIVMQQSNSYGFWSGIGGLSNISNVNTQLSFTAACDAGETIAANSAGSEFTDYWNNALRFIPRGTIYADQETTDVSSPEPVNNFLVSMKKAFIYSDNQAGLTPKYEFKGSSEQYLGLPSFLIRDGDQQVPADWWWESPDIFLTHPENPDPDAQDDTYHADTENIVNVNVTNNGTHPVRSFYIGSIIFLSGGGGVGESVVHIVSTILKPGESYEHSYSYDFSGTETHRCIRAKAQIELILEEDLDQDGISDVAWAIEDNDNEAQRNLDQFVVKKSSSSTVDPGNARVEEDDVEEEAEPVTETGEGEQEQTIPEDEKGAKSLRNIRGLKEHLYVVKNIFDKPHKFMVVFPENHLYFQKLLKIECFEIPEKGKTRPVPVKMLDKPVKCFTFSLDKGAQKELMFHFAVRPKTKFNGELKIPFEILVDTKPARAGIKKVFDKKGIEMEIPDYLSFAGITVKAKQAKRSELYGKVISDREKPVGEAYIFISTLNGRQSAVVKSDSKGNYHAPWIDPDTYTLWAKSKYGKSKPVTVILNNGAAKRVDIKFAMSPKKKR